MHARPLSTATTKLCAGSKRAPRDTYVGAERPDMRLQRLSDVWSSQRLEIERAERIASIPPLDGERQTAEQTAERAGVYRSVMGMTNLHIHAAVLQQSRRVVAAPAVGLMRRPAPSAVGTFHQLYCTRPALIVQPPQTAVNLLLHCCCKLQVLAANLNLLETGAPLLSST